MTFYPNNVNIFLLILIFYIVKLVYNINDYKISSSKFDLILEIIIYPKLIFDIYYP